MFDELMELLMLYIEAPWFKTFIVPVKLVTARMAEEMDGSGDESRISPDLLLEARRLISAIRLALTAHIESPLNQSFLTISNLVKFTPSFAASSSNSGASSSASSSQPKAERQDVSPVALQQSFGKCLRGETQKLAKFLSIPTAKELYQEALAFAKIRYTDRMEATSALLADFNDGEQYPLPTADEIVDQIVINETYQRILNDERIVETQLEMHLAERPNLVGSERDEYIAELNRNARLKNAGNWAASASSLLKPTLLLEQEQSQGTMHLVKQASEKKQGRDAPGRLAYMLMNIEPRDMIFFLLEQDLKQGDASLTGIAKLGVAIADAFTDTACHKDARKMTDLLSQEILAKQTEVVGPDNLAEVMAAISSDLSSCSGTIKVLKLSNYENHSVVYLVDESQDQAILYESIAANDSQAILFNDLITGGSTPGPIKNAIAKVKDIAGKDGGKVEWEVHKAVDLDTVQSRMEKQLRNGATAMTLCLAVSAHETKDDYKEAMGGEDAPADFMDRYEKISLPLAFLTEEPSDGGPLDIGSVRLYEYTGLGQVSVPQLGAIYRMNAIGKWFKVQVVKATGAEAPAWLGDALDLKILDISDGFQNAQLRDPIEPEKSTTVNVFVFQITRKLDSRSVLFNPANADYEKTHGAFVIVEDPFWATGGPNRKIIYRPL